MAGLPVATAPADVLIPAARAALPA
jgi:hypothetical protein